MLPETKTVEEYGAGPHSAGFNKNERMKCDGFGCSSVCQHCLSVCLSLSQSKQSLFGVWFVSLDLVSLIFCKSIFHEFCNIFGRLF